MHFAFFAPPFTGHLRPMAALAARLAERGHRATLVGTAEAAARWPARPGLEALALGGTTHPAGTLAAQEGRLAALHGLNGLAGLARVMDDMSGLTAMLCAEAPAALRALGVDAVVSDQLEAAGGLVARHLRLPQVSVANALMIDREPGVPPPFTPWAHATGRWARERNLGGWRVSDWMMRRVGRSIAASARRLGLDPAPARLDDCLAPLQVGQLWAALDFPREALPAGFRYSGPLRAPLDEEGPFTPPDRPYAFVSLGTLQGGRFALLSRLTQACSDEGLACVVAHGGRLSAAQAEALPGRHLQVHAFVPQRRVLAGAAVALSHGGLNTTLDALAAGVPLVLLPLAMEQAATAQRVVRVGAGLRLPAHARTGRIRHAVAAALNHRPLREAAAVQARHAAAAGGAAAAARWIEAHARAPAEALAHA